ncbi:unnamed protein product [Cylindrotheca closterium]|uniref:Nicastrin n=1 Tax=Cylindrotheca closterium TaxID=2856 RepID=A0AAD2FXY5_9STRA|nr:unnamed protein product [Cylindrotheca closterium]
MMHSSDHLKLHVLLLVITRSVAFQSFGSIRSVVHEISPIANKSQQYYLPRGPTSTTKTITSFQHRDSATSCLWSTLVIAEDPTVSFGVSLVNGANGKGGGTDNKANDSKLSLHPTVSWLPSFSLSFDDNGSSFETVHTLLQGKEDAENLIMNLPRLDSVTCLGIHVVLGASSSSERQQQQQQQQQNKMVIVAPETAQRVGGLLQEILDATETMTPTNDQPLTIVMSLDLPVHLAMLRANCLPKTRTNRQLFHVLQEHTKGEGCRSILAEYLYDWNNPFGGTDPLACPSREFCNSSLLQNEDDSPSLNKKNNGPNVAAALTALLGLGLEPSDALRDAQIVATSVSQEQINDFTWKDGVQRFLASYSSHNVDIRNEDGLLRKAYIEFGYK